jgi:MarR family transcriptional regulator, organic hydroperoxide resistance regulator
MPKQNFETGFVLNRASFALDRHLNRAFAREGLTRFSASYLGVMKCLWERDGQSLTELSNGIGLEASSMTGLIDRMEKANLVKRRSDSRDRRVWRIHLTERGRGIQTAAHRVMEDSYEELTDGISAADLKTVVRGLLKFIENSGYRMEKIGLKNSKKGGTK